ncbi:MAG: hypothetical protein IJI27_07145 [Oscillospiraceae bacterium]|nr:hypothetical protein [Oscillospiraceae bacterium]
MAEVENLLGLITDKETRTKLLAQMEQMFDAAEDEGKLIEQIGSPTKVAVALIRYADKKRAGESAKAEAVHEPEAPVTEMLSEAEANAAAPEESNMPELAFDEAEAEPEVVEAPTFIEASAVELPEEDAAVPERLEEVLLPNTGFVAEEAEPAQPEEILAQAEEAAEFFEAAAEEEEIVPPVMDEAFVKAVAAEAEEAFGEAPAQEALPAQETEAESELVQELFGSTAEEADAEDGQEPEKEYVKVGWKAFLYFLIPGLVPGLPVFLVLFALSLVFLAIGVCAVGFAVGVFMSAFVGFNVVADMLLLLGAGASIFAVAMVLLWFGIWFLTKVCFGWVRLIHRGGVRFSRKEVQAA